MAGSEPIDAAHRGENSFVMARMRSGFAVIGGTQHLPGYSLLLIDDPSIDHLTDLDWQRRREFLFDMALLGEAVERACRPHGLRRINRRCSATPCMSSTGMYTPAMTGSLPT